jgi:hypothetical protein
MKKTQTDFVIKKSHRCAQGLREMT